MQRYLLSTFLFFVCYLTICSQAQTSFAVNDKSNTVLLEDSTGLSTYNIAKFLYPDVSRTRFLLSPDLGFSAGILSDGENNSSFSVGFFLSRSETLNSRKKQLNNNIRTNIDYNSRDNNRDNRHLGASLSLDLENRYFFANKRFFEIDVRFNYSNPLYFQEKNSYLGVSPKVGFGRIENITDSWHALSILEALENNGFLKKELKHSEIDSFAAEISRLKNFRNTDFRLEGIYEFESLLNFLIDNEITDISDFASFATLKDAYEYEGFTVREQGHKFKIGPEYIINNAFRDFDFNRISRRIITASIKAEYLNKTAKSHSFQFDQSYTMRGGQLKDENDFTTFTGSFVDLELKHTLGYYKSQRTNYILENRFYMLSYLSSDANQITNDLSFTYSYYLSPTVRYKLDARINILKYGGEFTDTLRQYSYANFGVDYFIR